MCTDAVDISPQRPLRLLPASGLRQEHSGLRVCRHAPPGRRSRRGGLQYVRHTIYHTYVSKLTLSVEDAVVRRAKRYAARRGTSVSRIVEQYLDLVSRPAPSEEEGLTPLLKQLRVEMKGVSVDLADYHRYLERKYR